MLSPQFPVSAYMQSADDLEEAVEDILPLYKSVPLRIRKTPGEVKNTPCNSGEDIARGVKRKLFCTKAILKLP